LTTEIDLTRAYLEGEPVDTIYFGGGTPSLYRPGELQGVMECLLPPAFAGIAHTSPPDPSPKREGRMVSPANMEITLELNPDDVTEAYVEELKHTWFNRFSIGVQSFDDKDLKSLNRTHSAAQALRAIALLQQAGYHNISIDLIFGIPSSSKDRWLKNLETAFALEVPHISAYALTIEPRTPLAWMIDRHKSPPVSDEMQAEQFNLLMDMAEAKGFQQYEISNFSKPGSHAIHNTNYWKGVSYLGLGPSAHSYNRTSRRWNVSNLSEYIMRLDAGEQIFEEEILTGIQKFNEYVMTSLRTMWGCNLGDDKCEVRNVNCELTRKRAAEFVGQGLLTERSGVYFLTREGKMLADRIASELFVAE
jgi:oxygen-independent coproporphyrinogen-3 oxidase